MKRSGGALNGRAYPAGVGESEKRGRMMDFAIVAVPSSDSGVDIRMQNRWAEQCTLRRTAKAYKSIHDARVLIGAYTPGFQAARRHFAVPAGQLPLQNFLCRQFLPLT
jgi:hypothetical protein